LSSTVAVTYGSLMRTLRSITNNTANKEPKWRHRGTRLTTGYQPTSY
jgi:hydrogenase small subunit